VRPSKVRDKGEEKKMLKAIQKGDTFAEGLARRLRFGVQSMRQDQQIKKKGGG